MTTAIEHTLETYGIENWGAGYFDVNRKGNLIVRPAEGDTRSADLREIIDDLARRGRRFELPPGSRAMETGGYKGRSRSLQKAELHSLITHHLGIPSANIICEYGMSELSSQAYDSPVSDGWRATSDAAGSRRMRFPTWCRVQIISPETGREVGEGETGLIRVFDLANVYSVIAIQTEDLGIRRGDGFELIGRAALAEPRGCSLMAVENLS